MRDPTERFSDRVEQHVRYRPSYSPVLVELLVDRGELDETDVVAEVGSGTGKPSELCLGRGNQLFGVELGAGSAP